MKNKDMEKGNEIKTVVPALRFPEFQGMNGWEEKKLEEIGNFIGGGTPNTAIQEYWDGGIPWYTPTEIKNGDLKSSNRTITEKGLKNSSAKLLPQGAILITTRATIGDVAISKKECTTNQGFQSLVVNDSESNLFWFYWIIRHKEELIKRASGSTFKEISKNEIINITSYSPKKQEQQKIAACLSSLDELIEATAQKVEALKEHKKGLMQRLFPAEGKNVPDLRFPEFQGMNGWEKKQVKDFGEVITGNTPSKKEEKYWNGDFVWITAQDFKGKYINDSILKLTKFGKDKARVIPKNSVLVTCIASIGLNAINKVECSTNQQINAICCNQEYNYEYMYYLVTYNTKNLKQLAGQTAVPIITKKSFEEFEVYAIENYDEQQKIADCLSSLDELIEATSRKVEILKEHKKGLMQQLFPKI
ncbi:restriction endonuclease subunit S [Phocaeicola coprophilus]|jgi:type I restriction enzyme S subunit|uniref:restriction endonuclease subunit S n=1 Tax=Phocaeicola coprophilus TaxID=387090 RepID=UPI002671FBB3|nr:restriction endonuclease subunit S [Phocaeicola coprophilus]